MTLGVAAIDAGITDENAVADRLAGWGWHVTPFGQRMWDARTCPEYGRRLVIDAVRRSSLPLRHAPDLLAGRKYGPVLLEVIRNQHADRRCMEVAKLCALDAWSAVAPCVVIDVAHETCWVHHRYGWPKGAVSDVSRFTRKGSGDPYAWFARDDERPLEEVFR